MLTTITSIITSMGLVGTFFWGLFADFLSMILANGLILFPIIFSVLAGAIYAVVKLVRRFGLKGKH